MERKIILMNTETGQELMLPVTPERYPMEAGRAVERLDMAQTGQVALPGLVNLFAERLEFQLPSKAYPYLTEGAATEPQYYIEALTSWSEAGQVCRYIVSGTLVNRPVLLGPLAWEEKDGSNDVYCTLPIFEYRYLTEAEVVETENKPRQTEPASEPVAAGSYTVVKGDSLWSICRKFYGDGSLAYRLATANGIQNPNLIHTGQVLTLPDKNTLMGYEPTYPPASPAPGKSKGNGASKSKGGSSSKKASQTAADTSVAGAQLGTRESLGLGQKKVSSAAANSAVAGVQLGVGLKP